MRELNGHRDLIVWQKATALEAEIIAIADSLPQPREMKLRDQLTRSSASVGAHIAEAYGKRDYTADFCARLRHADSEAKEARKWLDSARMRGYLAESEHAALEEGYCEVGRMLGGMMRSPERFKSRAKR